MEWMFEMGKLRCDGSVGMNNMKWIFPIGKLRCDGSFFFGTDYS